MSRKINHQQVYNQAFAQTKNNNYFGKEATDEEKEDFIQVVMGIMLNDATRGLDDAIDEVRYSASIIDEIDESILNSKMEIDRSMLNDNLGINLDEVIGEYIDEQRYSIADVNESVSRENISSIELGLSGGSLKMKIISMAISKYIKEENLKIPNLKSASINIDREYRGIYGIKESTPMGLSEAHRELLFHEDFRELNMYICDNFDVDTRSREEYAIIQKAIKSYLGYIKTSPLMLEGVQSEVYKKRPIINDGSTATIRGNVFHHKVLAEALSLSKQEGLIGNKYDEYIESSRDEYRVSRKTKEKGYSTEDMSRTGVHNQNFKLVFKTDDGLNRVTVEEEGLSEIMAVNSAKESLGSHIILQTATKHPKSLHLKELKEDHIEEVFNVGDYSGAHNILNSYGAKLMPIDGGGYMLNARNRQELKMLADMVKFNQISHDSINEIERKIHEGIYSQDLYKGYVKSMKHDPLGLYPEVLEYSTMRKEVKNPETLREGLRRMSDELMREHQGMTNNSNSKQVVEELVKFGEIINRNDYKKKTEEYLKVDVSKISNARKLVIDYIYAGKKRNQKKQNAKYTQGM